MCPWGTVIHSYNNNLHRARWDGWLPRTESSCNWAVSPMCAGSTPGTRRSSVGLISPDQKGHQEGGSAQLLSLHTGSQWQRFRGTVVDHVTGRWRRRVGDERRCRRSVKDGLHFSGITPSSGQMIWAGKEGNINTRGWSSHSFPPKLQLIHEVEKH